MEICHVYWRFFGELSQSCAAGLKLRQSLEELVSCWSGYNGSDTGIKVPMDWHDSCLYCWEVLQGLELRQRGGLGAVPTEEWALWRRSMEAIVASLLAKKADLEDGKDFLLIPFI